VTGAVAGFLVFSAGALLLVWHRYGTKTRALSLRLAHARGGLLADVGVRGRAPVDFVAPPWLQARLDGYNRQLRLADEAKPLTRFLAEKAIAAVALPLILLAPYAAVMQRLSPLLLLAALALGGFFIPDLSLHEQVKRRRERIFLDLPDALAMMALALGAGQSLRQALELAARDCGGPLGHELARALTRARRERSLDEREALVQVAHESGEPQFARFSELLAAKESPYLDFLRTHATQSRAEQNRLLEQAADRAYLAMHAPLAPLLAALVLLVAYGFLHFLAQTM
jgi:tight adherence protein C